MRAKHFLNLVIIFASLLSVSCTAYKKLPYLENADSLTKEQLAKAAIIPEARIIPNDILSIVVNSSNPIVVRDFNLSLIPQGVENIKQETFSAASAGSGTLQNYIVDKDGNIEFPILGRIHVVGLSRTDLQNKIANMIYPKYVTSEKPLVNVRFLNFRIAVLGEVQSPGVYTSDNGVMSLFDALAMAGDLTIYGKRENVMLIRESENGELSVRRFNLQDDKLLLDNDIYYLRQNDKIVVEVNKSKGNSSGVGSITTIGLSVVSLLVTIAALITR